MTYELGRAISRAREGRADAGDVLRMAEALAQLTPYWGDRAQGGWRRRTCIECHREFAEHRICSDCLQQCGQVDQDKADQLVDAQWAELKKEGVWTLEELQQLVETYSHNGTMTGFASSFVRYLEALVQQEKTMRDKAAPVEEIRMTEEVWEVEIQKATTGGSMEEAVRLERLFRERAGERFGKGRDMEAHFLRDLADEMKSRIGAHSDLRKALRETLKHMPAPTRTLREEDDG